MHPGVSMNPDEQIPQNEVEVEAIMQEIRTHILESKASRTTSGDLIVPAGGERLHKHFTIICTMRRWFMTDWVSS